MWFLIIFATIVIVMCITHITLDVGLLSGLVLVWLAALAIEIIDLWNDRPRKKEEIDIEKDRHA